VPALKSKGVLIALAVGLLLGAGATYTFGGQELGPNTTVISISTTTSTVTIDLTQQVSDAYLTHLQDIKAQNISALIGEFATNSSLSAQTNNPTGGMGYLPTGSVTKFYSQVMYSGHPTVNFANQSYATTISSNESAAVVHSNLTVYGESLYGPCNINPCSVYVEDAALTLSFVHVGNDWLISNEFWYFVNGVDGCQSFSAPSCSTLLNSPNWSEYIGP
jgi:hypothetical protein